MSKKKLTTRLDRTIQSSNIQLPTTALYSSMQEAYGFFNKELFEDQLPSVIFTTQRGRHFLGYFSRHRWVSIEGVRCHEIALNPDFIGRSTLINLMQTLVHEMVHCWQEEFGSTGRRGYHNQEWANKMIEAGLMPSDTGMIGGKITGDRMADYPIKDGAFVQACLALVQTGFTFNWMDRYAKNMPSPTDSDDFLREELADLELSPEEQAVLITPFDDVLPNKDDLEDMGESENQKPQGRTKSRYSCLKCGINVWGKPFLLLACSRCKEQLIERNA